MPILAVYHEMERELAELVEAFAWCEENAVKTECCQGRWRFQCFSTSNCRDESEYSKSGNTPSERFVNAYKRLREKVEKPPLLDDAA